MFTKKHYIYLASIIKVCRNETINNGGIDSTDAMDKLINEMAYKFESINPRFDKAKFVEACGVTE